MNYSKVNWNTQSAITQNSLAQMDTGIAALAEAVTNMETSVTALSKAKILNGAYQFTNSKDTVLTSMAGDGKGKFMKAHITYNPKFEVSPATFLQVTSGYVTLGYTATITGNSATGFDLCLNLPASASYKVPDDTGIWVQWIAFGT